MNTHFRDPPPPPSAAVARLMRRKWTVAEIDALVESGKLDEHERFELIDGEIVPMSAKGNQHELLKIALNDYWIPKKSSTIRLAPETTFRLTKDTFLEPDFVFYDVADGLVKLSGATCLLAVEVAVSSLGYDLGRKARLYAGFGIRELWVIDAVKLVTHVHRQPGTSGYESKNVHPSSDTIAPVHAPSLAVSLGALTLI